MKRYLWLLLIVPTLALAQSQGPYGIFGGPIPSGTLALAANVPAGTYAFTTDKGLVVDTGTAWVNAVAVAAGTKFTLTPTGCTPSATAGGATAGTITLAATCTSIVIIMNGASGLTAATGWHCSVGDRTAQLAGTYIPEWYENSSTTTTATIPIPGAVGTTDVIAFSCAGF